MSETRSERFEWGPDDIVMNDAPHEPSPRERVRRALGDAAHAMSDADIDRIIAAAAAGPVV